MSSFLSRRPLLLLTLAILALFVPALIHPTYILFPTFSEFSDLMVIHWPKARLIAESWQAGQGLPHWTPLILSGMPLAANQLAMLYYPPAWLFLFFPPAPIFNLLFIFHFLLGGVGIFYLLREGHQLSTLPALVGGLTFALNGKWLAHAAAGHVSMVGAIGWLPWVVFGMLMLLRSSENRDQSLKLPFKWALLVAVGLALQLTTHTLIFIYSVYLVAAMVAWFLMVRVISCRRELARLKNLTYLLPPLLLIPCLAGLLGAVQLLPLLELAGFSNRALSLDLAAEFALTPTQLLLGLLLPSWQAGHEHTIYLGLIPLLLTPFALMRLSSKNEAERTSRSSEPDYWPWFYAVIFIFSLLFALGPYTPLHSFFYYFAPGFSWVRTPARMFFVGGLALAGLVGFGLDNLSQAIWSEKGQRWLTRAVVGLGATSLLLGGGLMVGFGQIGRASLGLTLLPPLGLSLLWLKGQRRLPAIWLTGLLGLLLWLDLASFDASLMRFGPQIEALAPGQAVATYLAEQPGFFRVYSPSYSLPMQTAAEAGLALADGVEPVHLASYDQFMARAGGYPDPGFSVTIPNFGTAPLASALKEAKPNLALLGLLNVKYLASAFPLDQPGLRLEKIIGDTYIYRIDQAMPRAWLATQTVPVEADWVGQLERLAPNTMILSEKQAGLQVATLNSALSTGPINISRYTPDRIDLEVAQLSSPGAWLVLSEIWYPGWQAQVNGQPQAVERVNGLLRGVYLAGTGPFEISLTYQPVGVRWGDWISLGSAVLTLAAGAWLWKQSR